MKCVTLFAIICLNLLFWLSSEVEGHNKKQFRIMPGRKHAQLFPDFTCHRGYKENRGTGSASAQFLQGGGKLAETIHKKCKVYEKKCTDACVFAEHGILVAKVVEPDDSDDDDETTVYSSFGNQALIEDRLRRVLTGKGGDRSAQVIAGKLMNCKRAFDAVAELPCDQWDRLTTCVTRSFSCRH